MTQAQRDAIVNPAEGLIVICTDCGLTNPAALSIYINGAWRLLTGYCTTPAAPTANAHYATLTQIIWNWNTVAGALGYKWNTMNNISTATDMGTATTKTETGLTCNTSYTRYIWTYNDCGQSSALVISKSTLASPPSNPTAGTHVPGPTQIVWNWNAVTGATGYKWNTVNNVYSATDMGTNLSKTETGLTCNTPYTRYIWAYGTCGTSSSTAISATTSLNPPASPVASTHVPSITQIVWNWNSVAGATGYKWNTINDYATAIDIGTNLSKTETGLICNTAYTRYVWAYSACGISTVTILNQTTLTDPPATPMVGTHVASQTQIVWNWFTVPAAAGYKWNTTNDYASATDMGTAITKTETGLTCNTPYMRYVWSYNNCGHSTATLLTQTTAACWICGQPITDTRDSKTYNTVLIGTQCWFAQNLNIGTMIPGSSEQNNHTAIEKYCYNNAEAYCTIYGGLYQWDNMMQWSTTEGAQGICPTGWHIPTDGEWTVLTTFLGGDGVAGGKMKEAGYAHWADPNTGATNSSGFTALPGGARIGVGGVGGFDYLSISADFFSSSLYDVTAARYMQLDFNYAGVYRYLQAKTYGYSGRCLQD